HLRGVVACVVASRARALTSRRNPGYLMHVFEVSVKEVPAPTPEVGRPIEAGNYMPNNSQTKMGPFSVVSDGKCRTPNLRLFQQFLSQRQLSSRAQGQKHAKGSSSFLRFRSVTLT